jgi:hypothetical protein
MLAHLLCQKVEKFKEQLLPTMVNTRAHPGRPATCKTDKNDADLSPLQQRLRDGMVEQAAKHFLFLQATADEKNWRMVSCKRS